MQFIVKYGTNDIRVIGDLTEPEKQALHCMITATGNMIVSLELKIILEKGQNEN